MIDDRVAELGVELSKHVLGIRLLGFFALAKRLSSDGLDESELLGSVPTLPHHSLATSGTSLIPMYSRSYGLKSPSCSPKRV